MAQFIQNMSNLVYVLTDPSNMMLEFCIATGGILTVAFSLAYKPTLLKTLVHLGLFIIVQVLTLAYMQNYIFATFLLFTYVGAVMVLFTVVLLTQGKVKTRSGMVVRPNFVGVVGVVGMMFFFYQLFTDLTDHVHTLEIKQNTKTGYTELLEHLGVTQDNYKTSLEELAQNVIFYFEQVLLTGGVLFVAMLVVITLMHEVTRTRAKKEI